MTQSFDPPAGWRVWAAGEAGRLVLAYRPDVFDGSTFPAACLPVCYVTRGRRSRRPGRNPTSRADDDAWFVTLYVEPEVHLEVERFERRPDAVTRARERTAAFAAGDLDYRSAYQVPREDYLDRLDELTGRSTDPSED